MALCVSLSRSAVRMCASRVPWTAACRVFGVRRSGTVAHDPSPPQAAKAPQTPTAPIPAGAEGLALVYRSPLGDAVRRLKIVSLTSCVCTTLGGPFLAVVGTEDVPLSGRIAIASVVVLFGMATTGAMHWVTRAFVRRLFASPDGQVVAAETLSVLARPQVTRFGRAEMEASRAFLPFVSFEAAGKPFYVQRGGFLDRQFEASVLRFLK